NTTAFLQNIKLFSFKNEYILIKGIRTAAFEKITEVLEEKLHNTIVEINLTAIKNNVNVVQASLPKTTQLICVLKAFGYGTGGIEIAKTLQQESIAYIAVAYIDEAIELRLAGITTPIILLHVSETNFKQMVAYQIEPEIFSLELFICFNQFLIKNAIQHYPIHIKINTGMNRLGFELNELKKLGDILKNKNEVFVKTVFSHLAEPANKPFSIKQVNTFKKATTILQKNVPYPFYKHILSTSGILLYPKFTFDFVRLGIGIYGIGDNKNFENPIHIYTTIAQIKKLKVGENIGYGCTTKTTKPTTIAIVQIGYADGYRRNLGNGVGKMYVKNQYAPTIGNICMDLCMIEITDIPEVKIGDRVEVIGNHIPITEIAEKCNTITYEILTNIGKRIKRVYVR
ncbi:MAG: alanine racemase, partial [Sediminibacterium sp.]|nr:alanine racemase [Sediminibacterium sp.]